MNKDWQIKLQEDFPFMRQDNVEENSYNCWGFECSGGWAQLLRECCEAIAARYAEDGIGLEDIDFIPVQIKEKFGSLRFYFGYAAAPCGSAVSDFPDSGISPRFDSGNEDDDDITKKRRHDIKQIVWRAEEKSECTCEECGAEGVLRDDRKAGIFRVQTLCDECHEKRFRVIEEKKRKIAEKTKE